MIYHTSPLKNINVIAPTHVQAQGKKKGGGEGQCLLFLSGIFMDTYPFTLYSLYHQAFVVSFFISFLLAFFLAWLNEKHRMYTHYI